MTFYANPDPTYQPAMRLITGITNTNPAVITTSFDHDYQTGTVIRLYVPKYYGMFQINHQYEDITVLTSDTFSVPIDSTKYDTFVIPATADTESEIALCVPIGTLPRAGIATVNVT